MCVIPFLSIVVPCHNEEPVIDRLCEQVLESAELCSRKTELILVDDGSQDATLKRALAVATVRRGVRVISFSRNFGKEAAMLAGLRAAAGDAVVIMDADLQHPPQLIPELVRRHEQGYDQVVARRDRAGDPPLRSAVSAGYYRLVNRMIDVRIEDGAGDFRLLSRRAVDALLELPEVTRFSKGLFSWIGFPSTVVQYANVKRPQGNSSWTLPSLLNYGIDGVISFNNKPLRASVWLGFWAVLVAVAYVVWLVVEYLRHGVEAPGYLTTIAIIVLLGGFQLIFLGVLGEYVGRIYYESKRRPPYIIAREFVTPESPSAPASPAAPAAPVGHVGHVGHVGSAEADQTSTAGASGVVHGDR